MSDISQNARFDLIRYAAVWEDADVLLAALRLQPGAQLLCICSAGDNALSLLAMAPESVTAIDLSEPQLHLAALKKAAFITLAYKELLCFLGDAAPGRAGERSNLYNRIRPQLADETARFWDGRKEEIAAGILEAGKFERYFAAFRNYFLPLTHGKSAVSRLLEPKPDAEQQAFFKNSWNNLRWRALMQLFFSRMVLGRWGRDPAFLAHVKIPVSRYIREKAEGHLQTEACTRNPFLHRIFNGTYGDTLPHYLRRENFEAIRNNAHRLRFKKTDAATAISAGPYDAYALSNIFEYMSPDAFLQFAHQGAQHVPSGAPLAFWNLMAPRSFAAVLPEDFSCDEAACAQWSAGDNGFFYSRFRLETRL